MKKFGIILIVIISISFAQSVRADFPRKEEMTKEDMLQKAKIETQAVLKKCMDAAFTEENLTTQDSLIASKKANDCIEEAIKQEIKRGFEPKEQAEILQDLIQSREAIFNFYNKIYNTNKYCYGYCGTIAQIFPYEDEAKLLQTLLESLYYLNIAKNGY